MNNETQNLSHFEILNTEFELSLNDSFLKSATSEDNLMAAKKALAEQMQNKELQLNEEQAKVDQIKVSQTKVEQEKNSLFFNIQDQELSRQTGYDLTQVKAEADSLPHVLVDEELLQEFKQIPNRFGFKIGDVADLLGIKQYVLRYWEQEFEILKPKKAQNNQRIYTKKDVENAFLIRKLLYRNKFSIEGARQALKDVKLVIKNEKAKEKAKEKDFSSVIQKLTYVEQQVSSFVLDIRKTKNLFKI